MIHQKYFPNPDINIINIFKVTLLTFIIAAAPISAAEITIIRDEHGTPHVYAGNTYGVFYGYGYSIAQDRLYQMEMAKRSTQGRVSEVLGSEYLDFDIATRSNYDPTSIMSQLALLSEDDRNVFDGYAASMNEWIDQISASPETLLPKQFSDNDFLPQHWTGFDVVMIFVGSMGNRFGDYNTELENLQLLNGLVDLHGENAGWDIFNQLNPLYDPTAPTTVPKLQSSVTEIPKLDNEWVRNLASLDFDFPIADTEMNQAFSNMVIVGGG